VKKEWQKEWGRVGKVKKEWGRGQSEEGVGRERTKKCELVNVRVWLSS